MITPLANRGWECPWCNNRTRRSKESGIRWCFEAINAPTPKESTVWPKENSYRWPTDYEHYHLHRSPHLHFPIIPKCTGIDDVIHLRESTSSLVEDHIVGTRFHCPIPPGVEKANAKYVTQMCPRRNRAEGGRILPPVLWLKCGIRSY